MQLDDKIDQKTLPNAATSTTSGSPSQFGADIGNGALKLSTSDGEMCLQSYIYYLSDRAKSGGPSSVEYVEGDRTDLKGKIWVGGTDAYYFSQTGVYRVTDTPTGKVELGLQLLLSALASMPYRPSWNIAIALSIHDVATLGRQLKQALEGQHSVILAGLSSLVNIKVLGVLEEGAGAIQYYNRKIDTTNAVFYDFGNGTVIISQFAKTKLADRFYAHDAGVERLIDAVARHESVRAQLKREGDRHLIRTGIESGKFVYGTQYPNWIFQEAYQEELPIWVRESMAPALRQAASFRASATAQVAIGGGAALPGISPLLERNGISVLDSPQWANVRGLYSIATRAITKERIK